MKSITSHVRKEAEEGFTLIELMVVVLILGILMAIAIPTFLSLTNNAKKNAAQADLTTALTDAAVYYTANGTFGANSTVTVQNLMAADANIQWALYGPGLRIAGPTPLQPANGLSVSDQPVTEVPFGRATAAVRQVLVSWVSGRNIRLGVLDKTGDYYWVQDKNGTVRYAKATTGSKVPGTYKLTSLP